MQGTSSRIDSPTIFTPDALISCDGALSSDGWATVGFSIRKPNGEIIKKMAYSIGQGYTTVQAEYVAVCHAIKEAKKHGFANPLIKTDLENIVDTVQSDKRPSSEKTKEIYEKIVNELSDFDDWLVKWIPSDENTADGLASGALET